MARCQRIGLSGRRDATIQGPLRIWLRRAQAPVCRAQENSPRQERVAALIRVDDSAPGIEQKYSGTDLVKHIGESSRLGSTVTDGLADPHRALDVGDEHSHAPEGLFG